jgi:hypothetical protein
VGDRDSRQQLRVEPAGDTLAHLGVAQLVDHPVEVGVVEPAGQRQHGQDGAAAPVRVAVERHVQSGRAGIVHHGHQQLARPVVVRDVDRGT